MPRKRRTKISLSLLAAGALCAGYCSRAGAVEGTAQQYTPEFRKAMGTAMEAFTDRDFAKARAELEVADRIVPFTVYSLNTRAAIEIEEGHYAAGEKLCRAALEKDPKFFPARFNLGEIHCLQKDYPGARTVFKELLTEDPTSELLQYRVFMTYLVEKNDSAAQEVMDQMKFPCDTGGYYYARAAWAFAHGDRAKAVNWIKSGDWVFSHRRNLQFADVLYDLGWMVRPSPAAAKAAAKIEAAPKPEAVEKTAPEAPGPAAVPETNLAQPAKP